MNEQDLLRSILRNDLSSFVQKCFQILAPGTSYHHNWHIDAICHQLLRCLNGEITRLIITIPPRSLKSIAVSVAFPAYVLGHNPSAQIIGVSYAQDLSQKHARDCRAVMQSPFYREIFPRTRIDRKKNAESEFMTTRKGTRIATSIGGTLTGRGGDIILIDDPHKPDESLSDVKRQNVIDWYRNTLASRLNDKEKGVIIVIQQRVHEEDLAGYLLEQGGWTHLNLPAIAEEDEVVALSGRLNHFRAKGAVLHEAREPQSVLDQLKRDMGSYAFAAQYQQTPAPAGGGIIKTDWFKYYDVAPIKQSGDIIYQSWDTASKDGELNDFSVCTTWLKRGTQIYLLNVYRKRLEFPGLRKAAISQHRLHNVDRLVIEDKGSGTGLIQDLKREGIYATAFKPDTDKVTRMSNETPAIEAGDVWLPKQASWLEDFIHELSRFPNGKHDDQVDSVSQALNFMLKSKILIPRIRAL